MSFATVRALLAATTSILPVFATPLLPTLSAVPIWPELSARMASGGAVSPLTAEGVQDLAARSAEGRFLAGLVLVCPDPADESASFYVVCNVVYARSGGFMFVAPEFEGEKC